MELVTLVHLQFNRIGSASRFAMVNHHETRQIREISDDSPETLRELVVTVAEELGETPGSLRNMQQVNPWHYSAQPGTIAFNINGPNVQYSSVYAVCLVHPALKVGDRYFKLEEVGK